MIAGDELRLQAEDALSHPQARYQIGLLHGFGEQIVGPLRQGPHRVAMLTLGGEEDHQGPFDHGCVRPTG